MMKAAFILAILVLVTAGSASAVTSVSSCQVITSPGVYVLNMSIINSGASKCIEITSSDVIFDGQGYTIDGQDTSNTYGVYVYTEIKYVGGLRNVTVKNVIVTDWAYGIYYNDASNGIIENNTASNNEIGIRLFESSNNIITNNKATLHTNTGPLGFCDGAAIELYNSHYNTIANNTANFNYYGICSDSTSNYNTITNNTASNNNYGIVLYYDSKGNTIYNNLFNNTIYNYYIEFESSTHSWNTTKTSGTNIVDGPYLGGNFWAYPNGTGFSEQCTDADGDGICDLSYTLASGNVDYLPLSLNFTAGGGGGTPIGACTTITSPGEYVLNMSIINSGASKCIEITSSDVIFDGQGHTIDGTDAANTYGVYVYNSPALTNVTIRNLTVTDWYVGIYLKSTENSTITDNTATSNSKQGIYLTASSNNNTIINNDASGNQWGIYLLSSTGNTLINNTANSNYASGGVNAFGIVLYSSNNNILINNTASSNTVSGAGGGYGIYLGYLSSADNNTLTGNIAEENDVGGIYLLNSANNTLTDNTAKENDGYDFFFNLNSKAQCSNVVENNTGSGDRPVKYFNTPVNLTGEVLSALILCNADNSNITNVTITGSSTKDNNMLQVRMTDYSNFTNINSSDNWWGITLTYSNNNNIADSTLSGNTYGLEIAASTGNNVTNNIANSNSRGVYIQASSTNNTLANNTFLSNTYGIRVSLSSYNNILNNTIAGSSQYGIWLYSSSNNTIYNNIMNNTKHTYFTGTIYGNYWNITKQAGTNIGGGPYLGGNFWAKPDGAGFSETCSDSDTDGICDSYYNLTSGNVDYLPLVMDTTPPGDVNTTVVQRLDYYFNITWTTPSDPDLKEFNIYQRQNDNESTDTLIDTVPANYMQPYIAGPGTDDGNFYQYMVTAVDESDNEGNGTYAPIGGPIPPIPFAPFGTLLTLGSGLVAYGYYRRKME